MTAKLRSSSAHASVLTRGWVSRDAMVTLKQKTQTLYFTSILVGLATIKQHQYSDFLRPAPVGEKVLCRLGYLSREYG